MPRGREGFPEGQPWTHQPPPTAPELPSEVTPCRCSVTMTTAIPSSLRLASISPWCQESLGYVPFAIHWVRGECQHTRVCCRSLVTSHVRLSHNPPGSSVHGISQARKLEWVAISFSRRSFQPRDQNQVSCIGRQILYHEATREMSFSYSTLRLSVRASLVVQW